MKRALLLLLCWGVSLFGAVAQDTVWVALIKGDGTSPTEDARLERLQPRLKAVFGFEAYHLLHEAEVPSGERYAQWVLPRKDFYLKLEPVGGDAVKYELYRDKTLLVEGKACPKVGRPVFIAGPDYLDGRLIFLLQRHVDKE